tara:strand:+ start:56137 stop:56829 length:693 start_codon:yes stop_codon:yes gene_type:complete
MFNKSQFLSAAAAIMIAGHAYAGTLVVAFDPGTTNTTTALAGFATDGDMMDGMLITATFTDMSSETLAWADIAAGSGGVSGTGWSLMAAGDTFSSNAWTLANESAMAIQTIDLDGGPGDTIFDIDSPSPGTADSASGANFFVNSGGDPFDIVATYSDQVAITGDAPVGDLWRRLSIDFTTTPFVPDSRLVFRADTDNTALEDDLGEVPEPASLAIFAAMGITAIARRKRA